MHLPNSASARWHTLHSVVHMAKLPVTTLLTCLELGPGSAALGSDGRCPATATSTAPVAELLGQEVVVLRVDDVELVVVVA
jgi:hypothetical protein